MSTLNQYQDIRRKYPQWAFADVDRFFQKHLQAYPMSLDHLIYCHFYLIRTSQPLNKFVVFMESIVRPF